MTYEDLLTSDCSTLGNAAGQANSQDHSIYWHPSLYMEASSGNGYVRVPTNGHKVYYIDTGTGDKVEPFEYPAGFRMIAGDPTVRGPTTSGALQWTCYNGNENAGSDGAFPSGVSSCSSYPYFNGEIEFPHCWNGNDFDINNPYAHMAYPEGSPRYGACPSSHPKRLPHLFMENFFNVDAVAGQVKPNSFVLSQGDTTGYGWHADFFNGWEAGALPNLLEGCESEDVGSCPNFVPGGSTSSCKLPMDFQENVDSPAPNLPGCNPISGTTPNPAPKYVVGPLGSNEATCAIDNGSGAVSPAAASSAAPAANSAPASATTAVGSAAPTGSYTVAPAASSPATASYAPNVYAYGSGVAVTSFVTVTSTVAVAQSPAAAAHHAHHNHHGHGRHGHAGWWSWASAK